MKNSLISRCSLSVFLLVLGYSCYAQINPNVYTSKQEKDGKSVKHELKIDGDYLTHTVYEIKPAKFIKTLGGFYKIEDGAINVQLEFNSNFENDSITQLHYKFEMGKDVLKLHLDDKLEFKAAKGLVQELDGKWLFGTRGPDKGQERRGDSRPRKTLKFLQNGRFQWIAYNTETMKFFGTGGGSFTSKDGVYQENIEFFSRDNSRVGAELKFEYGLKGNDWHHQGNNSKGEPMYEIWMRRQASGG
ncbi:MAG: hypothetical protein KJN85_01870 [Maribacter sp.]|nr:hypothetical protein [Maribacter sp.]